MNKKPGLSKAQEKRAKDELYELLERNRLWVPREELDQYTELVFDGKASGDSYSTSLEDEFLSKKDYERFKVLTEKLNFTYSD